MRLKSLAPPSITRSLSHLQQTLSPLISLHRTHTLVLYSAPYTFPTFSSLPVSLSSTLLLSAIFSLLLYSLSSLAMITHPPRPLPPRAVLSLLGAIHPLCHCQLSHHSFILPREKGKKRFCPKSHSPKNRQSHLPLANLKAKTCNKYDQFRRSKSPEYQQLILLWILMDLILYSEF